MLCEPLVDEFTVMHTHVIADDVNAVDGYWGAFIDFLQKFNKLNLSFSKTADADNLAAAGIERCEQVCGASPGVLVFDANGHITELRRQRLFGPRSWLKRRFFIDAQNPLIGCKRARIEFHDALGRRLERRVPGNFRAEPVVHPPGLEFVTPQDPLHRLGRDGIDNRVTYQRPGEFRARPKR